jgi:hypothetical protein
LCVQVLFEQDSVEWMGKIFYSNNIQIFKNFTSDVAVTLWFLRI